MTLGPPQLDEPQGPPPFDGAEVITFETTLGAIGGAYFKAMPTSGEVWLVRSVGCTFATTAAAATRRIEVRLINTLNIVGLTNLFASQVANNTYFYTFSAGYCLPVVTLAVNNTVAAALPLVYLTAGVGSGVQIFPEAVQIGDNILNISITYQRWRF